jgi:hypothetical protein
MKQKPEPRTITFSCPRPFVEKFRAWCKRKGIPFSAGVRLAMSEAMEQRK